VVDSNRFVRIVARTSNGIESWYTTTPCSSIWIEYVTLLTNV